MNNPDHLVDCIYIVSRNIQQANILKNYINLQLGLSSVYPIDPPLRAVIAGRSDQPNLFLVDCMKSNLVDIKKTLDLEFGTIPDHIWIVLYNMDADCNPTALVKQHKIRGLFSKKDPQSSFRKGLKTILNGNLWLSRKLLSDCILMSSDALDASDVEKIPFLTRREKEVLQHVTIGKSNQEIAVALSLSPYTVKTHLHNVYKKINVSSRLQAALWITAYLNGDQKEHGDDIIFPME
jgi:LuxR family transcriptional regulator of csgAB operon